MSLKARLNRLERDQGRQGRCPECPPLATVEVDDAGELISGEYPRPCPRCGGPHDDEIRFIEVHIPGPRPKEDE